MRYRTPASEALDPSASPRSRPEGDLERRSPPATQDTVAAARTTTAQRAVRWGCSSCDDEANLRERTRPLRGTGDPLGCDRCSLQILTNATNSYQREVHVPSLQEATNLLVSEHTTEWHLSEKGKIADALLADSDLSILLRPSVYEAIAHLTSPRSTS